MKRDFIFIVFLIISLTLSAQAGVNLLAPQEEGITPITTTLTDSSLTSPATSSVPESTSTTSSASAQDSSSSEPSVPVQPPATSSEPSIISASVQPTEPSPTPAAPLAEPNVLTLAGEALESNQPTKVVIPGKDSETRKINLAKISSDLEKFAASKNGADSSALLNQIESDFAQTQVDLYAIRADLAAKNLSPKILTRFDDYQTNYENQISSIIAKLKSGNGSESDIKNFLKKPEVKIENPIPFRAAEFNGQVKKVPVADFPQTTVAKQGDLLKNLIASATLKVKDLLSPNLISDISLPTSNIVETSNIPLFASNISTETSNVRPLTSNTPNPEDLAESEEIKFTQSIKDLAISLGNDPLTIFNFTANNINYVPYYGSKKGADATLIEKAGNDFDQASLLIALLRVGDSGGLNKTPARYKQAAVKLSVGEVMDLLGVEDSIVAATVFEKTGVPYVLYVDQNQNPVFFVVELTYVEAYVDYDYTRGVIQGNPGASKRWVPLVPFLAKFYKSQHLNALDFMSFDAQTFYDNYLNGNYGTQKPVDALKSDIQNYLTANHPDLTLEDAYVQTYRSEENLEFLPLTPPFEIVSDLGNFSAAPENLKHRLEFSVISNDGAQIFLAHTSNISSISNKELLLEYIAATPDDQAVIDSFPTIYDVVPLSLVSVKPVIKINGQIIGGGSAGDLETRMGKENKFKITFKSPAKDLGGPVTEKIVDAVEKATISGNSEGIAINTDFIVPPETRPSLDTQTSSPIAGQKLWKTAENYLYRLESSHDELARITGGRFTNLATRAVVFNGITVNYQSGEPYSFSWQGLRIDSSSFISYYSHFSQNPSLHQKEFLYVFGLAASLDEADIFEADYSITAISTVKGLKLVNQNQIPGVTVKKITLANESDLDTLNISDSTKIKLRDAVHQGHIVYTPTAPFTYESWTGLVYIDLDPNKGDGGYIIGEGLNGGYTATPVESWPSGLLNLLINKAINNLTAVIVAPTPGQQFTKGQKIPWQASYSGVVHNFSIPVNWTENLNLDTSKWSVGNVTIPSGYGTTASVNVRITQRKLGATHPGFDHLFFKYGENLAIPPDLLKSMAFQESCCVYDDTFKQKVFDPQAYRYEAHKDYDWYSGPFQDARDRITRHPEWHFAIGGTALHGEVEQGNQVPPVSEYQRWSFHMSGYKDTGLIISGNNKPTAQQLLDKYQDPYWIKYKGPSENWNFTAQLLLSSSYGVLQALYDTALTRMVTLGLETKVSGPDAQNYTETIPIQNLFDPDFSVKIGAGYLKNRYDVFGTWQAALTAYNGSESYAVDVLKNWNNGNGIFKEITE